MKTKQANLQKSSLFLLAASSILLTGLPAQALVFSPDTTDFTITTGKGTNNASSTININTNSPSNGFGSFFTSNFLLLGADPQASNFENRGITGSNSVNDGFIGGNTSAESTSFTLDNATLAVDAGLKVEFDWAFQGDATAGTDNFDIKLIRGIEGDENYLAVDNLFLRNAPSGYGSGRGEFTITSSNLTSTGFTVGDEVRLQIALNENLGNSKSSAAGYDNISATTVPFEFSPTTGLLMVGGFFGLTYLKKRRQVSLAADFDKDFGGENQS
jgi:hypothetical protein